MKQRNFNHQKRAYRAEITPWTGDNLPEVSAVLLELGYDNLSIERGTIMARGKSKPLLCVALGNFLRFGEDDSFKVMRPEEKATYVPIQSDDELRAENDRLRALLADKLTSITNAFNTGIELCAGILDRTDMSGISDKPKFQKVLSHILCEFACAMRSQKDES